MEKLVQRLKQKDSDALDALIHDLYPQIYSYVYVIMKGRDCSKDITQEVFLRFIRSLDTFEYRGKTKQYVLRIAANCCKSWYQRNPESETPDVESIAEQPASTRGEHLRYYLMKLPKEQREVLLLKYYQGWKSKEIADVLGISDNTVKTRIRLGIHKLKQMVKEDEL